MTWPPSRYEIPEVDTTPPDYIETILHIIQADDKRLFVNNLKRLVEILREFKTNAWTAKTTMRLNSKSPFITLFENAMLVTFQVTELNYLALNINFMNFMMTTAIENENAEFEMKPESEPVRQIRSKDELVYNQYKLCCLGILYYYAIPDDKKPEALARIQDKRDFANITEKDLLACVKVKPENFKNVMARKVFRAKVNATLKNKLPNNLRGHVANFMGGKRRRKTRKSNRK